MRRKTEKIRLCRFEVADKVISLSYYYRYTQCCRGDVLPVAAHPLLPLWYIMKRLFPICCALLLLFSSLSVQAAQSQKMMTISLPESVLAEAITATLPLEYNATSKSLQGNLRIINISDLQLLDKQLACRLHLAGDHLKIVTELAGNNIQLNVGEIELDFQTRATLRFDRQKQTLYVTPMIEKVNASKDAGGGDIGNAVIQLLHGNEFPIKLEDLDPLVTKTGSKTLTIATKIADIRSQKEWLQIFLDSQISARPQ